MKRLTALALCWALLALMLPMGLAEEGVVQISDVDGLRAMQSAPRGRYRLTCDIDMAGVSWTPIPFSGELDGGGHTLYNLTVTQTGAERRVTRDGNRKEYATEFAGLFSTLENATITDLNITGAYVSVECQNHCFAAILTGYADHTTLRNVSVNGRVHMVSYAVMVGVAGLVGWGNGTFERCAAKVELVFEDRNFDFKCEEFLAGILACGIANIDACAVDIDGYDSCHGYVHNGGIVGMYYHCGMDFPAGPVNNNIIDGRIHFFEDNTDRRAYCKAVIGEPLTKPTEENGNHNMFTSDETSDYSVVLRPEMCADPHYTLTVMPPTDGRWGYTRHTCDSCGYSWKDSYVSP